MIFNAYKCGDFKSKNSFCIFPVKFNDKIYWLERVKKTYEYMFHGWGLTGIEVIKE